MVWEMLNLRSGSFCVSNLQIVVFPVPDGAERINIIPFDCMIQVLLSNSSLLVLELYFSLVCRDNCKYLLDVG